MWGLKALKVRGSGQGCVAVDTWLHILVILFYPTLTSRSNALPKESPKRNKLKEKIETDKRRKHFFHTFLYLLGEGTNQRYIPRRSVVPKTPDSKMMLLVQRTLPEREKWYRFLFQGENPFFFYACVISFSVRHLWEFLQI